MPLSAKNTNRPFDVSIVQELDTEEVSQPCHIPKKMYKIIFTVAIFCINTHHGNIKIGTSFDPVPPEWTPI